MTTTQIFTPEETARRGDEIYEQRIRPHVEAANHGKIVAVDTATGAHTLGDTALSAARLLCATNPDAEIYFVRVGHSALHHIGAAHDPEPSVREHAQWAIAQIAPVPKVPRSRIS